MKAKQKKGLYTFINLLLAWVVINGLLIAGIEKLPLYIDSKLLLNLSIGGVIALILLVNFFFFSRIKQIRNHVKKFYGRHKLLLNAEVFFVGFKISIMILIVNEIYVGFDRSTLYSFIGGVTGGLQPFSSGASQRFDPLRADYSDGQSSFGKSRTSIYSIDGRFQRTYRWNSIISDAEAKYHIPPGLIAGLIMQESMGNPLQLNTTGDGGAGLMMFQPGTARDYGLRTYGNSNATGPDHSHGNQLIRLITKENYQLDRLRRIDERFDPVLSINAGSRFMSDLYKRHRSWNNAISAYNRGTPALLPLNTRHVRNVKNFQIEYLTRLKAIRTQ
jgi:hypothetical protein